MKPDGPMPAREAQGKFSAMVVDNESGLKDKKPVALQLSNFL